ncbi:EamA domain-containing membrane protein RarD [Panacagrimonas perspica]|uniref:EamA domain-containing membrane protein RarD n=1 Tax=Panacagrimonas perspica TaxID=381431 RepID=A0A4V3URT2_9GAMM|nr:DMT family transporter [Panacagrimonas perspica]TDU26627.1 EamA domain-containing membrane protein RarD [Panacagrimonas perspica]THD04121.1 EamA family transporter [Panacagrimonas perspica]
MSSAPASAPAPTHPPHEHYLSGILLASAGAIFFSAKAVVAKLLYREGIDAVTLLALRMLLATPVFLLVALWTSARSPRLSRRDLMRVGMLGVIGYYGSSMLDFIGLQYITAGLERLILFLTPSFVLLLGVFVFKRGVTGRQWLSMGFAYAGIVLVFSHDVSLGGANVVLGAGFVLAAAVLYAIYLLYSGELIQRVGTLRLVALAMSMSSILSIGQYLLLREPLSLIRQSAEVWTLSAINASLCTALPVFLTMFGVARAGAGNAAQAGMIGPISTLFLAWWILGEPLTAMQGVGTGLVLVGIYLLSTRRLPAITP